MEGYTCTGSCSLPNGGCKCVDGKYISLMDDTFGRMWTVSSFHKVAQLWSNTVALFCEKTPLPWSDWPAANCYPRRQCRGNRTIKGKIPEPPRSSPSDYYCQRKKGSKRGRMTSAWKPKALKTTADLGESEQL